MTKKQNQLLNPWSVSSIELEDTCINREVLNTELNTPDSHFNKETIEYYINRVKGGVGMITVKAHSVNQVENNNDETISIGLADSLKYIGEAGEMIDQIHDYGARVFMPLIWEGDFNKARINELSQQTSDNEVEKMATSFVKAALIAKLIGYDGVQINVENEGYLLEQFSKTFYGLYENNADIKIEERLQFITSIVRGIKNVCGTDYPVTLRFRMGSFVDAVLRERGWNNPAQLKLNEIPEALEVIKVLAIAGYDALDIDAGPGNSWCLTNEPSLTENDGFLQEINYITNGQDLPLFGYSMIENIDMAAKALDKGIFEAIEEEQFLYVKQSLASGSTNATFEYNGSIM